MPGRRARAVSTARRAWPYVVMAWERWQALPEAEKERYRRRAREFSERGRTAIGKGTSRLRRGGPRR